MYYSFKEAYIPQFEDPNLQTGRIGRVFIAILERVRSVTAVRCDTLRLRPS